MDNRLNDLLIKNKVIEENYYYSYSEIIVLILVLFEDLAVDLIFSFVIVAIINSNL